MELKIGDNAPDFSTKDETGNLVSLAAFRNQHPVALVFFPKDDTPG